MFIKPFSASIWRLAQSFLLLLSLAILGACASIPGEYPADTHAPAQEPSLTEPEPSTPDSIEVIAYRPSPQPVYTRPEPAKAVQVLQFRAADQRAAGQLVAAAGSLERALRIEPRNPVLWNQLAHIRLEQKQYQLASGLAAKSNAFADTEDHSLRRDNQAIIARAKSNS